MLRFTYRTIVVRDYYEPSHLAQLAVQPVRHVADQLLEQAVPDELLHLLAAIQVLKSKADADRGKEGGPWSQVWSIISKKTALACWK